MKFEGVGYEFTDCKINISCVSRY